MPRPKNDGSPAADERLEAAFFDALREMPFDRITVSNIVKRAGLNRNSFYYHFSDLEDLAHSAVQRILVPEIPQLIASGFRPDSERFQLMLADLAGREGIDRMLLVIGPHSTPKLRSIMQDAVMGMWLESFHLSQEDIGEEGLTTVRFVLGGMFEVLGRTATDGFIERLDTVRKMPIVQACATVMTTTFKAAAVRSVESKAGR
ncbi:TetR/AcrR family transcriptional regulator [Leucobacter soli]|uniref:HTH tetR-type domain-containing protein n=2 Tax=Leucobacter soli TaxID=2812850 RepID=A0A916JVV8_9MICO|nr:TetR/AcrR family transcriptional regulator [Leucobacter soli]CAG7608854.1 hypothetical protein LEUCIP111803_01160 [Leucobacter soli]